MIHAVLQERGVTIDVAVVESIEARDGIDIGRVLAPIRASKHAHGHTIKAKRR